MLCGACTSESIEDRATFPSASKGAGAGAAKKPVKKKAQKSVEETLYKPVVTLQQCCLSVRRSFFRVPLLFSALSIYRVKRSSRRMNLIPVLFVLDQVIGQYINDVEALGDIGPSNLDRVAKIVCKNRALTSENLKLFLEIGHRELRLYDCTSTQISFPSKRCYPNDD